MSAYRTLNRTVLAKVEVTPGTDPTPTVGSNAILTEAPTLDLQLNTVDTNESTGSLDVRGPIPAGGAAAFSCGVNLHGSGTAETPPEFGVLLKGCGMAETITSSAVTGTAQAGASGSITLAAGSSSVDDYYTGMPINTTGGTGNGQTRIISAYNGTSKVATVSEAWTVTPDNTTTYSIPKNVKYAPTSSSLPTLAFYLYEHRSDGGNSRLMKLLGSAGNLSLALGVRDRPRLQFQFRGQLVAPSDVSAPAAPTLQSTRPYPWLSANVRLGGATVKMADLSLDLGNQVQLVDDPNVTFGYGVAGITRRQCGGEFQVPQDLLSALDPFTAWLNSTQAALTSYWGSTAGNKWALTVPGIQYTGPSEVDRDGFGYLRLPFRALGDNKGLILVQH